MLKQTDMAEKQMKTHIHYTYVCGHSCSLLHTLRKISKYAIKEMISQKWELVSTNYSLAN